MLDAMTALALDYLKQQLPDDLVNEQDSWEWYLRVREEHPESLFPYLIEAPRDSMSPNYYILKADPKDSDVAILEQRERKEGAELLLPFVPSTGSQSGALGPVIKRTYSPAKGSGPSAKINDTSLKDFKVIADSDQLWSEYFEYVTSVVSRPKLQVRGEILENESTHALALAVHSIEERQTCFLSVLDAENKLPGEVEEYIAYLQHILAAEKYSTGRLKPIEEGRCSLTGIVGTVYPNGLAGAGLNLSNMDRPGVFPGLDDNEAWKKYALSAEAADLLYTFSYHVSGRFRARVAGENALIIPYTTLNQDKRRKFMRRTRDKYLPQVNTGKPLVEQERVLHDLANEEGIVTNLTILWADFGQKIENVRGMVTDILPSRLRDISVVAGEINNDVSLPFPQELRYEESLSLDVAFNSLAFLLRRPGGKRTEKANKGARLFEFKREMVATVYHGQRVPVQRFWDEVREVCEAYLVDALERNHYGLLYEGRTKQGENYLTMAGWIRHLSRFIYFLRQLEVYPEMEDWRYQPKTERLRSVFGEFFEDDDGRSGIDQPEKAYAFLLGALFGKLMQVQGARGVNVGANALPWLKRFTLTGKDLPHLYVRIREKLLTYGTTSKDIADVIEELGHLGTKLGTHIDLNQTETGYFLLLGQSLSSTFMPSKATQDSGEDKVEEST
ncbi:hypothetical protein BH24ACT22_BH24ACT22_02740 [soil metagenome]